MDRNNLSALKPENAQLDLFMCDLNDAILKDDMASMEHPIFTLSKKPDIKIREYEHNGNKLTVTPSVIGHATIYDKDILIYAISKLMQAKKDNKVTSKKIVFEAHECLKFIHRTNANGNAGGHQFRGLEKALERLKGTMLKTNIVTGGKPQTKIFGIIDEAIITREDIFEGRVLEWGIVLSDWIYNSVMSNEVLTLHHDYFRLRKPLEKRVYELARRHCGKKKEWKINLKLLLKKSGAKSSNSEFRRMINFIVKEQHLPDYNIYLDEKDLVIFTKKEGSNVGIIAHDATKKYTVDRLIGLLPYKVQEKSKKLAVEKNRDYYQLISEFVGLLNDSEPRKNISGSLINFIKSKKVL